ncbi:MAG: methyltransferase domain-containing protein [Clostridia bacterium]|nr:methyltransferase domain-containing protein [Clostridia bacterium]
MEDAAHTMNNGGHAEEAGVFRCPLCAQALQNDGKRLFCARGHSFDLSREGYVNLLPGRGGAHGDDRGMIEARRRFLEGGHYLPLRLTLCRRAAESAPRALLDAGCGEGWYTEGLANALPETEICAVDVSKDAVRYTAKRLGKRARCAVASVTALPLGDSSVDAVVSVFAPLAAEEFRRVLRSGGVLILAVPGAKHLWQLKEMLYAEPYENQPAEKDLPGFEFVKEDELHYLRALDRGALSDLFAMTPYFYRTPPEGIRRLGECEGADVEMAFRVLVYRKKD